VTFLRVNLASVGLIFGTDQVKVEASLPQGLTLSSNNLATLSYQKVNHVRLPRARVRCLLRDTSVGDSWLETASVTLDLNVDAQLSSPGWQEARNKQLSFIQAEDRATRRIPFAYERLRGRGDHFIAPHVLVSSLLSGAAYSYHGLVVLRHLTVPGWPSRDTKAPPNITNNLHQQTSSESIDDTSFSMIDSDTRLAYVFVFCTISQCPKSFTAYHARFHHIPVDTDSTIIRTKPTIRRGPPAQRAQYRVTIGTHPARPKVSVACFRDLCSNIIQTN